MNILLLGYGREGKSTKRYLETHDQKFLLNPALPSSKKDFQSDKMTIDIRENFDQTDLAHIDYDKYDLIFRSPSVPPIQLKSDDQNYRKKWTSATFFFFKHCPCPIIGVTGTKGKGTTCSLATALLKSIGHRAWLVGNIGTPALDVLDQVAAQDFVIYELSSFQLWDLPKSPQIAAVLHIEPDHLNVHYDFDDYIDAKANITKWQSPSDSCIYYQNDHYSRKIANLSPGQKFPYPLTENDPAYRPTQEILNSLSLRGQHNRENAEAALLIVSAALKQNLSDLCRNYTTEIKSALQNFQGLPHRLQQIRKLNNVTYYDDNFSTTLNSTKVALQSFDDQEPLILIIGGRDKTSNEALPELTEFLSQRPNLQKIILIGESGRELAKLLPSETYIAAQSLAAAVHTAQEVAEQVAQQKKRETFVLMSPAAASFDMFKNVYDRGDQFQKLVEELK